MRAKSKRTLWATALATAPVFVLCLLVVSPHGPLQAAGSEPRDGPREPNDRNDPNRAVAVLVEYTFDDPSAPDEPSAVVEPDQVRSHEVRDPNMTPGGQNPPTPRENHPDFPGRSGLWGLSGARKSGKLIFDIANYPVPTNKKYVKLEYEVITNDPNDSAGGPPAAGAPGSSTRPRGKPEGDVMPDGGFKYKFEWVIDPQPAKERIVIPLHTGAHADDYVYVDNVKIYTKCLPKDADPNDPNYPYYSVTGSTGYYYFDAPAWPPGAYYEVTSPWSEGELWLQGGSFLPVWLPGMTDHEGVFGLPGGFPADAVLGVHLDGQAAPEGVQYVAYQFDYYAAEGGLVWWEPLMSPGTLIQDYQEQVVGIGNGWQRVYLALQVAPPPEWQELNWSLATGGRAGPVVIDNLVMSDSTYWNDFWNDPFDIYDAETGVHGQYGWRGWDNNPLADGFVTEAQANTPFNSLKVAGPTDLVQEYDFPLGRYTLTAWQFVPAEFQSACDPTGLYCGSFLILLNTYQDGGPYNWSVQLHADSLTQSFIRDQEIPVALPLVTDRWVKIDVLIDLDSDLYRVYYDGAQLGSAASWTAGVYGGGGGALDIGALDLYANGSSPVYYDDIYVRLVSPGDLDCDDAVDFDDISPFVVALSDPATYSAAYPSCNFLNADCNNDGAVNFDDINPFIAVLSSGGPCP